MTTFETIKSLADKQKISLKDLAIKLGFSENNIYRWKNSNPKASDLAKVADYFRVSVDFLLGRENRADYNFDNVPFTVKTSKNQDGTFSISTSNFKDIDSETLGNIETAKSTVLNQMNKFPESNIKSDQYSEFRIEQFFIDELMKWGINVVKVKPDPEFSIELEKSIDHAEAYEGTSLTDEDKAVLKGIISAYLANKK